MLSLNKLLGSGRSSYVVSCELPDGTDHHVVKSRNFDCSSADDLGAQANAVRFAKAAETVPEFRAFLFGDSDGQRKEQQQRIKVRSYVCMREKQVTGVRYAVAMCRLDNGQLRSISFLRAGDDVTDARGENQVLGRAEQFLRSVAFENWRKQVSKESPLKSREQQAHGSQQNLGKERGLKHPHSFVEIDQGEKVDCKCGKNRSHGLMMACERCGAWEHAECQGFRSKQQIPADYICSACVRAEREEVIIIRCEEQGKFWSTSVENAHTGMAAFREHEDSRHVCYLCGCEDNEYFEPLVQPCGCVGCSLVAHTSCITTMKLGASSKDQRLQKSGVCSFCGSSMKDDVANEMKFQKGGRWVEEAPDNGKLGKSDQLGVARKRLRSTGSGGSALSGKPEQGEKLSAKSSRNEKVSSTAQVEKVQPEASPPESKKGSSPFLGRRFSDAAANVPIKKRRIQLEMARSPSPPPGNVKSDIPSVHEVLVATKPTGSQSSEDVNVTDGDSDENGSGSRTLSAAAQVQKIATNISNHVSRNISKVTGHSLTASGTDIEGSIVGSSTHQLVGCKTDKGEAKLELGRGNRSNTENGSLPAATRSEEKSSLAVQVGALKQHISSAHVANTISDGDGEQACALKLGIRSEDVLPDPSREVRTLLSPNSKRKFSETDMSHPAREHLREEDSSRSRPTNRAGSVNLQTSVVGSRAEESVRGLTLDGGAAMQSSALAGNNNSLRDDRLHWDLNMDMEEWERPTVEDDAVATVQNLPLTPNSVVEKRGGLLTKEFFQESHKRESGIAVGTSTSLDDGGLEHKSLDSADATKQFSATDGKDSILKSEVQIESKDDLSLGSLTMAQDQRRSDSSPGAVAGIYSAKLLECPDDKPEMVCDTLQADRPAPALLKDNQRSVLDIAPAPDQEKEVRHVDESPSVGGPVVDKETKGKVFLIADKGADACTTVRADTSCVNVEEDICGNQTVREPAASNEAADIVQPEKQLEFPAEDSSQKGHAEVLAIPMVEPTPVIPLTKISPTRNVTEAQKCDEGDRAPHEDEGERAPHEDEGERAPHEDEGERAPHEDEGKGALHEDEGEGVPHEDEDLIDKEVVEEYINERIQPSTSPPRQPAPMKWEGDNGEDLEAEDVDYGDSDMREGEDVDMEDSRHRGAAEVESTWNPKVSGVQDAAPSQAVQDASASQNAASSQASPSHRGDADDLSNATGSSGPGRKRRHLSESSGAQGMIVEEDYAGQPEDPKGDSTAGKRSPKSELNGDVVPDEDKGGDEHGYMSGDSRRTSLERAEDLAGTARSGKLRKSEVWREPSEGSGSRVRTKSGWDQLPEGFQSAEEALQATRSNAGNTGWTPHYQPGFSGWNGGPNMHYTPGDNRYMPGHGRGMLPGPAAERAPFDKPGWSNVEHPRRSRMDARLEIHGRVPDLRQSRPTRPIDRPRQRGWADDGGPPPPLFMYGPGRQMSPPGPGREPYGFHPHKTRNAAAVAAAKVESSGLVVAPDGTVIKAGAGAPAPLRGMGGKGRGFDMVPNGVMTGVGNTGLSHSLRVPDAPPHFKRVDRFDGHFPPGRGAPPGMVPSRYNRWTRDEREFGPPVETVERPLFSKRPQRTPLIPDDGPAQPRKSRITEPEAGLAQAAELDPSAPPPPKLPLPPPPPKAQRSPPAGLKRLISKRDGVDYPPRGRERSRDREWDSSRESRRSHYSPSRRSSPHVIHGSALTDERDRLLLAGIDKTRDSVSAEPSHRGRSLHNEEVGVKSRVQSSKDVAKEQSRAPVTDRARDFQKPGVSYKHSSSREGEDDVAPRRRRPS